MKTNLFKISLLATMLAFVFISCSDNDDNEPWIEPEFETTGAYILSEGTQNNAMLSFYDIDKNKLTKDVFGNQNNKLALGDLAQDILIYGSKMYITVDKSNTIFITDLQGKLIESKGVISLADTEYKNPRYLVAHKGSVYVDFYSGHVAKLDTTKLEIVDKVKIAAYPEQMVVTNDELYVTNSQYYGSGLPGNTVTVVNLNTFKVEGTPIELRVNPTKITSDSHGNVFVLSMGIYGELEGALSVINSKTKKVKIIKEDIANEMVLQDNRLLLFKSEYPGTKFSQYDIYTEKIIETPFITIPDTEKDELGKAYHISIDPISKDMYISTGDYSSTGSMYIFSAKGEYKTHFNTGGVYSQKAVFVSKQTN